MIYKANTALIEDLLKQPETGMGYQFIQAESSNQFIIRKYIVYNSELIVDFNDRFQDNRRKIQREGYSSVLMNSNYLELRNISLLEREELKSIRLFSNTISGYKGRKMGGKGAVDNHPVNANGRDVFVRLSAYENDKRIDFDNKCLRDGTYTTTEEDYLSCKYHNDDAVDRYALPNDEEIKWAFYIEPKSNDTLRPGIVQPANGHYGGGVETLFDNGTSRGTYIKKTSY